MTSFIYTIMDQSGLVLYAGMTLNPTQRELGHLSPSGKFHGIGARFRVLRQCAFERAAEIEAQIIRAYKRRGQCAFNVRTKPFLGRITGVMLECVETGERFLNYHEAGRRYGCSPASVNYSVGRLGGMLFDGVTLKKAFVKIREPNAKLPRKRKAKQP